MTLLADGAHPVLKFGSAGPEVRRVQRALNAASNSAALDVTGVFTGPTQTALRAWQDAGRRRRGRHRRPGDVGAVRAGER